MSQHYQTETIFGQSSNIIFYKGQSPWKILNYLKFTKMSKIKPNLLHRFHPEPQDPVTV